MKIFDSLSDWHFGVKLAVIILFISCAGSFSYEFYRHITPSRLCLTQRYLSLGALGLMIVATLPFEKLHKKCVDSACVLLWLGCLASGYHLLLQYGILPEFDMLLDQIPIDVDAKELNRIVEYNKSITSTKMEPTIWGIPTTAGTFVMFVFLFIYISICFNKKTEET